MKSAKKKKAPQMKKKSSSRHTNPSTRDFGLSTPLHHSPSSGFDHSEAESYIYERSVNPNVHYYEGENNRDEMRIEEPATLTWSGRTRFGSDGEIFDLAHEVLSRHPEIDVSQLDLNVNHGVITLYGIVETRRIKRLIEDVIYGLPGVHDVLNRIEVEAYDRDRRRIAHSLA